MVGDTAPKRFRIVIDALAVVTIASLLMASYLFYDRITTSRETQTSTQEAIRTVLCFAQATVESDPSVTPARRARAVAFYTAALKKIDALPCPAAVKKP